MPDPIAAVRAFQVTDAGGHPLPSPQPIDLATDSIPYGARVRFEVEAAAGQALLPMRAWLQPEGNGACIYLYPTGDGRTFAGQVRLPWDLRWGGDEVIESLHPPVFPGAGGPPIGAGEHRLRVIPRTTAGAAQTPVEVSFRLGEPPAPGGAPPRIVSVNTHLPGNQVRLGQPWLLTAQVEDPDDDVLVVIFSVLQGDFAQWWFLRDDGTCGDEVAGDGIYSFLRTGGDFWERPSLSGGEDLSAVLSVQAADLRGNWSEPTVLEYRLLTSQPPLWEETPSADAPAVLEGGVDRARGPWLHPYLWARSTPGAWVCARFMANQGEIVPLFDDGQGPDAEAGDGVYSATPGIPTDRDWDIVLYAVPQSGPPRVGAKLATFCPAQA